MKKKYVTICLKWGLLLGIALSLLEVVKMFARNVQYGSTQIFELLMVVLYILLLVWGGKEFKETYNKRLSFSKAFLFSSLISLVGCVILFCYTLLHYSVIEKDGLTKKYEAALYNFKENVLNDTIRGPELTHYLDTVEQIMLDDLDALPQDSIDSALRVDIQHGIVLLNDFYDKKMQLRPVVDTALNYQLRHFTEYSRKTMASTLQAYLIQNKNEPSTPYVKDIVKRTNSNLKEIDPGEIRYNTMKVNVPNYNNIGTYASVSASMQLLSGMFFSIFVAMYLYRSKNPIEPVEEKPEKHRKSENEQKGEPIELEGEQETDRKEEENASDEAEKNE